ncbi:MAG: hypothetical protein WBB08_01095 [Halobacteriota archaeon]
MPEYLAPGVYVEGDDAVATAANADTINIKSIGAEEWEDKIAVKIAWGSVNITTPQFKERLYSWEHLSSRDGRTRLIKKGGSLKNEW